MKEGLRKGGRRTDEIRRRGRVGKEKDGGQKEEEKERKNEERKGRKERRKRLKRN